MQLRLAWRNLWRNSRRTFITSGSVFFAVILATLMMSIKEGTYDKMIDSSIGAHTGYVQIQHKEYWSDKSLEYSFELNDSLRTLLAATPGVTNYLPRIQGFALAATGEVTKGVMVVGVDPMKESALMKLSERVSDGAYFNPDEKAIMVGDGLARFMKIGVGDTLVLLGQGYHEVSAAGKYPIKGIVKFGSPELSKQLVFLPVTVAQNFYDLGDRYNALVLLLKDNDRAAKVALELQEKMEDPFVAMSWEQLVPELKNLIDTDRTEAFVFIFILYMVIAFGLFGTMLMMMAERQHEFGVMVAIGMKRLRLAVVILTEGIILSLLGATAGMLGSFPVCLYFNLKPITFGEEMSKLYEEYGMEAVLQASIDPGLFIQQALIIAGMACLVGFYPFVQLLRLNAIEAMRT
jgi:putative ABC transport system permease protein